MQYILPKGYLSASAIKTLQTCPRQYEFRYIHGIINPPNAALAVGSVAHKTLEIYYTDAMNSSVRLTPAQVGELSGDVLSDWVEDNEHTMSEPEREEAHKLLPGMMHCYSEKIGKNIKPLKVEQEVRFTMASGVPMLAYLDLVHERDGQEVLADYKITGKKLTAANVANSLQFNLYALMTGIGALDVHNIVKAKTKPVARISDADGVTDLTSNLRRLEHTFDGGDAAHFENLVEASARLITSGIFMPCAPDSWCCNSDWCGYWQLCRGKRS